MSASDKKKLRKEQAAEQMTEKQRKQAKEDKKLKAYTITFVVIMVLVASIALGMVAARLVDHSGIIQRNTKALTVGNHTLSSAELNYFYIDAINTQYSEWSNSYGNYTSMYMQMLYGLDLTKPLNEQAYTTDGEMTWADFFANGAIDDAKSRYALYDLAVADNHQLSEEEKTNMETGISNTKAYAKAIYGYDDFNDYLKRFYGYGAQESTYRKYLEVSTLAQSYYNAHSDSLKYDNAALREYEKEHYDEFSAFSFYSFAMSNNDFLPKLESGSSYTDEQRDAAAKAAKEAAEALKNETITNSAQLNAAIATLDVYKDKEGKTASKNTDLAYNNIPEAIRTWLAASGRKSGDFAVIPNVSNTTNSDGTTKETTNGYYLVVFEGRNDNTMKLVNVRHILKSFTGGTKDSNGQTVYSEAEKKAAQDAINKVKETWEAGEKTEESFAALVKENSTDTGSVDNGGLYEDVFPGQMVTAFNDWCFDSSRKAGDIGVVETEYGYHLIYFVGQDEMTYRDFMIDNTLRSNDMKKWYDGIMEKLTTETHSTSKLSLDYVITPQY